MDQLYIGVVLPFARGTPFAGGLLRSVQPVSVRPLPNEQLRNGCLLFRYLSIQKYTTNLI